MDNQFDPQHPAAQLSSTYPSAPMEYVNMYTNENVKSGKAPQPPKIIKDSYTSFGKLIDPNDVLIRSLESQGIQQLYSLNGPEASTNQQTTSTRTFINTNSYKRELKKLNHSILIAYLDLLEILVKAPNTQIQIEQPGPTHNSETGEPILNPEPIIIIKTLREQKLEDIELLFINMHHLINELRPHQARDNIRCILEMQKQQRIEIAQKFKAHLIKIVDLLKSCINSIQPNSSLAKSNLFLEEINNLMSSANQIGKCLDKFSNLSANKNKLNGFHHETEENDIEMKSNSSESLDEQQNNLLEIVSNTTRKVNLINNNNINNQKYLTNDSSELLNKNSYDIKDLILCDLIDDFMIKNENEF